MHRLEVESRERMANVEGLLEGLREAIGGKRAAQPGNRRPTAPARVEAADAEPARPKL